MRALVLLSVLAVGVVQAQKPLDVKLAYTPQDSIIALVNPMPPSIIDRPAEIRIEDGRVQTEPNAIGEGNDGGKVYPIRSTGETAKFLRETVLKIAGSQGLASMATGNRQLRVRVIRFWVSQSNKTVGAIYTAEVSLAYSLLDKAGSTLAEGAKAATATRYGRGRSPDNCNEVLSDALKEVLLKALDDPKLRDAWKIS